jgi:hypothetical protein
LCSEILLHVDGEIHHAIAQDTVACRHVVAQRLQFSSRRLRLREQTAIVAVAPSHNRTEHIFYLFEISLLLALCVKQRLERVIAPGFASRLTESLRLANCLQAVF